MIRPHVDDRVQLRTDVPELDLFRGEIGVVCSTWFAPSMAYEVEFKSDGRAHVIRALLLAEQLEVESQRNLSSRSEMLGLKNDCEGSGIVANRTRVLRIYPDPVLRAVAREVEHFDSTLRDLTREMIEIMRRHHGIGLAAPQVGVSYRLLIAERRPFSTAVDQPGD